MKGWEIFIVERAKTGKNPKCPFCGKDTVEVIDHIGKIRDSISLKCTSCGAADHYDGCMKKQSDVLTTEGK